MFAVRCGELDGRREEASRDAGGGVGPAENRGNTANGSVEPIGERFRCVDADLGDYASIDRQCAQWFGPGYGSREQGGYTEGSPVVIFGEFQHALLVGWKVTYAGLDHASDAILVLARGDHPGAEELLQDGQG